MTDFPRKILVTCALPYANGPLHLGHMLEHIQADIWVRYQRLRGSNVSFVCADDAHGTPIMLKAQQMGLTPEEMITSIGEEHQNDLSGFNISFDNYYSTHSEENREFSSFVYLRLKEKNLISRRTVSQFFDPERKMFLPDRFIMGVCPKCGAGDQHGDNCDSCGETYSPTDLINPKSILSGETPVMKDSEHFFFDLPHFEEVLKAWTGSGSLQEETANKVQEWFRSGLRQWDISRDAPYFGFEIPGETGKYFYVWLDAPIGYMASFKNLCEKRSDLDFDEYWNKESSAEIYHFIGKDIIYFHSLFWPAILEGIGFRKPSNIRVHGYVTVNGSKMSKSKGTLVRASTYLEHLDPDCLRYYYATKISNRTNDLDLNLKDFSQRVNSDVVNKIVNLAARNASFITKHFDCTLSSRFTEPEFYAQVVGAEKKIAQFYEQGKINCVVREITTLADKANHYIDEKSPWRIARKSAKSQELQDICSVGINVFRVLMTYLKPIMPALADRSEVFLNKKLAWDSITSPLLAHKVTNFRMLLHRIESRKVTAMFEASIKKATDSRN